jgi:hypothetical protein
MRVVRPSGVWNSRAPLHNFFYQSALIKQTYGLLTGAVARTRYDATQLAPESATSSRRFMRSEFAGHAASKAWGTYRDAWQGLNGKYGEQPSIQNVKADLAISLYAVRESTIVRYSALFEAFVQCWSLNMILAKLESATGVTIEEEKIAERFSPVDKSYVVTPGVPVILKAFPDIQEGLEKLPHISIDLATGTPVEAPAVPELNALKTISFWRDYRNHLVHRGSVISKGFWVKHSELFELLRAPYVSQLRPLEQGNRLQLPDVVYHAMATTHNKVARWLNSVLQERSGNSRGCVHLLSSGLPEPSKLDATLRPPVLLMDGDHAESLAWVDQFSTVPEAEDDSEGEDA